MVKNLYAVIAHNCEASKDFVIPNKYAFTERTARNIQVNIAVKVCDKMLMKKQRVNLDFEDNIIFVDVDKEFFMSFELVKLTRPKRQDIKGI